MEDVAEELHFERSESGQDADDNVRLKKPAHGAQLGAEGVLSAEAAVMTAVTTSDVGCMYENQNFEIAVQTEVYLSDAEVQYEVARSLDSELFDIFTPAREDRKGNEEEVFGSPSGAPQEHFGCEDGLCRLCVVKGARDDTAEEELGGAGTFPKGGPGRPRKGIGHARKLDLRHPPCTTKTESGLASKPKSRRALGTSAETSPLLPPATTAELVEPAHEWGAEEVARSEALIVSPPATWADQVDEPEKATVSESVSESEAGEDFPGQEALLDDAIKAMFRKNPAYVSQVMQSVRSETVAKASTARRRRR